MKNAVSKTTLNKDDEAAIQAIAERVGKEIRQAFANSLGEMLLLIGDKGMHATMEPSVHQEKFLIASELVKILKFSKALAYWMFQRDFPLFQLAG